MHTDLKIHYVCPLDDDAESLKEQVFMGFTPGVLDLRRRILATLRCPPSLLALEYGPETISKHRLVGLFEHKIIPVNIAILEEALVSQRVLCCVVLTTPSQDCEVRAMVGKLDFPVLHLPSQLVDEINEDPVIGEKQIRLYADRVAKHFEELQPHLAQTIRESLRASKEHWLPRPLQISKRDHGVTIPNEMCLELAGGILQPTQRLCSTRESDYVDAIRASTVAVKLERRRLTKSIGAGFAGFTMDLILACPGLVEWLTSSAKFKEGVRHLRGNNTSLGSDRDVVKAMSFCIRQESYSTRTTKEELSGLLKTAAFEFFLTQWTREVAAFTACLTIQSVTEICPAMRLPRSINRVRGLLGTLGKSVRAGGKKWMAVRHKLSLQIAKEMRSNFPKRIANFTRGYNKLVRFVADIPIEWIKNDSIPLPLTHFVARMPTTPGNLLLLQTIQNDKVFVNIDRIEKVQVIRSFKPDDPLKPIFEQCLRTYSKADGWTLEIEIFDVASEQDLVEACNKLDGPFVVYDGHGCHSNETGVGGLLIGENKFDVWKMLGRVKLPPVVILSTCDSCPVDGSHASSANGFLLLGAKTVVGTMLPVDATKSGIMFARLFYRLTSIVKAWMRIHKVPLSWMQIVGCQVRACYISELMDQLVGSGHITNTQSEDIKGRTNCHISSFSSQWIYQFRTELLEATAWNEARLDRYLRESFGLPDALLYVQLGNPEKVLFVTKDIEDKLGHHLNGH